jgi:hypothetical protein
VSVKIVRAHFSEIKLGSELMPEQAFLERSGAGVEPTERGAATPHRF